MNDTNPTSGESAEKPEATPQGTAESAPDYGYWLPMGVFLGLTWAGGQWPHLYAAIYAAKTLVVGALLLAFRRQYTPVRWQGIGWGVAVGIVGVVQWVGMQLWLQQWEWFRPAGTAFDPVAAYPELTSRVAFFVVRLAGAVLVVPFLEELFWRDFLWRTIATKTNFRAVPVGVPVPQAVIGVSLAFALVHGNWWLTSIVWALLIAGLLLKTRSLGACIIAHAVTNLLLAIYVMVSRDWSFW